MQSVEAMDEAMVRSDSFWEGRTELDEAVGSRFLLQNGNLVEEM